MLLFSTGIHPKRLSHYVFCAASHRLGQSRTFQQHPQSTQFVGQVFLCLKKYYRRMKVEISSTYIISRSSFPQWQEGSVSRIVLVQILLYFSAMVDIYYKIPSRSSIKSHSVPPIQNKQLSLRHQKSTSNETILALDSLCVTNS